ncbi:MAG: exo-alpha-sialidase [Polyangiales bacterium]
MGSFGFRWLVLAALACVPACGDGTEPQTDAATLADAASDSGIELDAGTDASVECRTAAGAFPRALGVPEPRPDGVFDPDLVRDPESGRLWLSYSAVDGAPGRGRVSSHLAYSDDDGDSWCYAGTTNESETVPLTALPTGITGTSAHWSHETSALVHDPGAPTNERWRLVWHRYLHVEDGSGADGRRFEHGWIAQRVSATPEGLLVAPEQKLFSTAAYHATSTVEAYNDAAPGGTPRVRLDTLEGLEGCLVATEPALLAVDTTLHFALFCARSAVDTRVMLIRLDHATEEFRMTGTVVTASDAATLNPEYDGLNAADLYAQDGGYRLLLTPTTASRYRGCFAFEIDLTTARLRDDTGDGPDPSFSLPLGESSDAPFGGACTALAGSRLGLIYGEVRRTAPAFTLTASGTPAP